MGSDTRTGSIPVAGKLKTLVFTGVLFFCVMFCGILDLQTIQTILMVILPLTSINDSGWKVVFSYFTFWKNRARRGIKKK